MVLPNSITHIHEINNTMSPARIAALTAAGSTAPELNNRALQLSRSGNHEAAITTHLQALQIKVAAHGLKSIHAGITLNALGEEYISVGDLEQAEEALKMARAAREMNGNNDFDSAVTRENLGRVYERTGDFAKARSVRAEGGDCVACSNWKCPGQTFKYSQMKHCAACRAPMYCSASCQRGDWLERHKEICQNRNKGSA